MRSRAYLCFALVLLAGWVPCGHAHILPRPLKLYRVNRVLAGRIIDYTANHGRDRRIYSPALKSKRDLYVYLPPGFDPCKRYPLAIYLHGFLSDEMNFLDYVVKPFDEAIACGKLPAMILACPDASPHGLDCLSTTGTFYVNSKLGAYEDFLVHDVYSFLMSHYPIRPEPEAHALLGVSMGGGAAFALVMKHRDKFGVATAFAPPLNLRWLGCHGHYFENFDPECWQWRTDFSRGREVIGRFFGGLVKIRMRTFIYPLYGKNNPDLTALVASENPIELLDSRCIGPGFAEFYVAYGGKDEFNLDAQIESFLFRAQQKGIEIGQAYLPNGRHNASTAMELLPGMIDWLAPRLAPFGP